MFVAADFPTYGNHALLGVSAVAILNSRHSRQAVGDHSWVSQTVQVLPQIAGSGEVLLTSTGMNTWELLTYVAGQKGLPQICLLPTPPPDRPAEWSAEFCRDFNLKPDHLLLVWCGEKSAGRNRNWQQRDRLVLGCADRVVPIAIRPGGNLEKATTDLSVARLVKDFQIPWQRPPARPRWRFDLKKIQHELDSPGRLIHWTRACDGPWPGETRWSYYQAVVESRGEYPRSGRRTLQRILAEQRLRASSWRIRGGQAVVAFTSLLPSQSVPLMTWRSRYCRFVVEPYGIAIDRQTLLECGARSVCYLDNEQHSQGVLPLWCQQSRGTDGDWQREAEYRHPGDLWLDGIAAEMVQTLDLTGYCQST